MYYILRKDDDVELICFWIFFLLFLIFFIILVIMYIDEVRFKRNSRFVRENKLYFIIFCNLEL